MDAPFIEGLMVSYVDILLDFRLEGSGHAFTNVIERYRENGKKVILASDLTKDEFMTAKTSNDRIKQLVAEGRLCKRVGSWNILV